MYREWSCHRRRTGLPRHLSDRFLFRDASGSRTLRAEVAEMQNVELFVHMAEIAGVFVGFGALIVVRSGGPSNVYDVTAIGMVVWLGIQVVADALVPIALSRFEVTPHAVWAASTLLFLSLFWVGDAVVRRVWAERRAYLAANPIRARAGIELVGGVFWIPMTVALAAVLLGVLPTQEEALYFAAVVMLLLGDATMLLMAVLSVFRGPGPAA